MKPSRFLLALVAFALFLVPITGIAGQFELSFGATIAVAAVAVVAVAFMPKTNMPGVTRNGVEVEMWSDYIASNLFKGWSFIKRSFDASKYVLQGKVVHIPQAGAKPLVVKNRSSLPAVAIKRTDTDVLYALDEYTTDPVVIEDAATVQLSYDKMEDVLGDHNGVLNEAVCDNILIAWAPATANHITRSTGDLATGNTYLTGATGSRRAYTLADLKNMRKLMNNAKVPKDGRVAIMTEDAWTHLEAELALTNSRDFSIYLDAKEGTLSNAKGDSIGRLYGFDIYTTPNVVVYDNAATPAVKAYGALGAAADNDAILCYQEKQVEAAIGEIKFFGSEQNPLYYGDVYSALVRCGGRKRYGDETGVYAIVQAAA